MKDRRFRRFLSAPWPEKLLWVLLVLLLIERLTLFRELGLDYNSGADEVRYIPSGIYFARTGMITYGGPYPTAMIMPGITVVIGLFSLVFGEGTALWVSLRVAWCVLGVITAYFMYRTTELITSPWCALLAAASFLLPNMAWMNHVVLTETPYLLFFILCIYYTLQMGRSGERRYFIGYTASFMLALMFRANIITMPLFTAAWLLFKKVERKALLRRGLALAGVLLLFVVPWTVRNYIHFDAFIPLTYGAGNPMLLGSYQGEGWPEDGELDYETHVDAVMREEYARYYRDTPALYDGSEPEEDRFYIEEYDPKGEYKELRHAQYLSLQRDGVKANYRLKVWFENDPGSFLKSFLFIKPRWLLNWVWAWEEPLGVSYDTLHKISQLNLLFCGLTVLLSFLLKKHRSELVFLGAVYFGNVYITAMAFVTDRYSSVLLPIRWIIAGVGVGLIVEAVKALRRRKT